MKVDSSLVAKATICQQWMLPIYDDDPTSRAKWFLDWVLQSPGQVSGHIAAGYHAYQSLIKVYGENQLATFTAHEYFAGMGAQSLIINGLLNPRRHSINDVSSRAYNHLKKTFYDDDFIFVSGEDAYEAESCEPAEIVALDIGDLTIWKCREGQKHRALLDRVFQAGAGSLAVVLTDIAGPRLHLQKERYETILGARTCDTYPNYLRAFARWIWETYQYELVVGYEHRWSAVMTFVPAGVYGYNPDIFAVPSTPIGMTLERVS